jgi:tetratricopeptide (TPR) repeat protein
MARAKLIGLIVSLAAGAVGAQPGAQPGDQAQSRTVLGTNDLLAQGAEEIRAGQYDEGIRHTSLGLAQATSINERAAALSNLCAAYAAKGNPDQAIDYCTQSLALRDNNWRAYSNRSYAYYLKGQYSKAHEDLDVAASINPEGRTIERIRGMINEKSLRPSVTMEDHR